MLCWYKARYIRKAKSNKKNGTQTNGFRFYYDFRKQLQFLIQHRIFFQ